MGAVPGRPKFKTKAEATEFAKEAFDRWLDRDSDDESAVTKPDIPVGRCFKNFLTMSLERAENPDEKFTLASQQNHIDNVKAVNKLTINGQRLEKMMLRSVGKSVVESVWKGLRTLVAAQTADDRFSTFKQAIRLSFKQHYIAGNPCELAEITLPNFDEEKIKWTIAACAKVQFSTLEKIVQHCTPEDRLKIIFAARTGIRQGEQIALKVYRQKHPLEGGIDFDKVKIYIRTAMKHALRRQNRYIGDPKSMAGFRNIHIDQELCDALRSYWEALPKRMAYEGRGLYLVFPVTGRHGP